MKLVQGLAGHTSDFNDLMIHELVNRAARSQHWTSSQEPPLQHPEVTPKVVRSDTPTPEEVTKPSNKLVQTSGLQHQPNPVDDSHAESIKIRRAVVLVGRFSDDAAFSPHGVQSNTSRRQEP